MSKRGRRYHCTPWSLVIMGWTWKNGTPKERGDTVRGHVAAGFGNGQKLCEIFHLSERGLICILAGYKWWPEFDADHQE